MLVGIWDMSLKAGRLCNLCHAPEPTKKCARCRAAYYCSAECARIDWNVSQSNHRQSCIPFVEGGIPDDDRPIIIVSSDGISSIKLDDPALKVLFSTMEGLDDIESEHVKMLLPKDMDISGEALRELKILIDLDKAIPIFGIANSARELWKKDPRVYSQLLSFASYTGYDNLYVGLSAPIRTFLQDEGFCDPTMAANLLRTFDKQDPMEVIRNFWHPLWISFLTGTYTTQKCLRVTIEDKRHEFDFPEMKLRYSGSYRSDFLRNAVYKGGYWFNPAWTRELCQTGKSYVPEAWQKSWDRDLSLVAKHWIAILSPEATKLHPEDMLPDPPTFYDIWSMAKDRNYLALAVVLDGPSKYRYRDMNLYMMSELNITTTDEVMSVFLKHGSSKLLEFLRGLKAYEWRNIAVYVAENGGTKMLDILISGYVGKIPIAFPEDFFLLNIFEEMAKVAVKTGNVTLFRRLVDQRLGEKYVSRERVTLLKSLQTFLRKEIRRHKGGDVDLTFPIVSELFPGDDLITSDTLSSENVFEIVKVFHRSKADYICRLVYCRPILDRIDLSTYSEDDRKKLLSDVITVDDDSRLTVKILAEFIGRLGLGRGDVSTILLTRIAQLLNDSIKDFEVFKAESDGENSGYYESESETDEEDSDQDGGDYGSTSAFGHFVATLLSTEFHGTSVMRDMFEKSIVRLSYNVREKGGCQECMYY